MALIFHAVVIIEAAEPSASLNQCWEALRLGRHLFIAESAARDSSLAWPEEMLTCGARILTDPTLDALFDFFPLRAPPSRNHELGG
jgi:DNA processing protein